MLQPSWLCFLDILGFREILAANNQSGILTLHQLLRDGRDVLEGDDEELEFIGHNYHALTAFTDNIALGFPIADDGEIESGIVFERVAQFQLRMVLGGFFVRGGIAFGDAYIDDLAVYGQPLLDAYQAETNLALDPRIVLTETAKAQVSEHLDYYFRNPYAPQNSDLKRDRDGQWFVDYLQAVILDGSVENLTVDSDSLSAHRDMVLTKLSEYRGQPRIWSKYEWVARYHNDFCQRNSQIFDTTFLIDVDAGRGEIGSILET